MVSCILLSLGLFAFQRSKLLRLENGFSSEIRAREQAHEDVLRQEDAARAAEIATEESNFAASLEDPQLLSGELAARKHAEEWSRRLAHDSTLASSGVEAVLLQMEKIGHDANVTAQNALEKVATMAAPRGSRVEVVSQGNGFVVRVAFRMSALSSQESGAVTKHHTTDAMRNEIQDLCSRVIRDLFDYCGSRGIEKISVSCNHALKRASLVPGNATDSEKKELMSRAPIVMANLYRASIERKVARVITNWRATSRRALQNIMITEFDGLRNLTITRDMQTAGGDPNGSLEF